MQTDPHNKTEVLFHLNKKQILIYSLYLSLGSLALFISLTGLYTTLQAILWQYTTKYIVNSAILSIVAFTAGILLIGSSYLLLKNNPMAINAGFLGCSLFLIYPCAVLLFEAMMPYSFTYLIVLTIPALVILIITGLLIWKKNKLKK